MELGLVKLPSKYEFFCIFSKEADSWDFAQEARSQDALSIEYFDENALISCA